APWGGNDVEVSTTTEERENAPRRARPGPPGRDPLGGISGAHANLPVPAGQGHQRAATANQRNRPRQARDHRGYGSAPRPLLREQRAVLAQPPDSPRRRSRARSARRSAGE